MKKISLVLAVILTLVIVLTGCGSNGASPNYSSGAAYDKSESYNVPGAAAPNYDGMLSEGSGSEYGGSDVYANENNKIIRTASMTIQTTTFDQSIAALSKLTDELGGYFETARVEGGGVYDKYVNRSAYYVVRVPKENFVSFRDGTGGIGHVYSISESTEDVGESYYDTEARLATLTTKRERLLALLEKAEKMEDIITLENSLADVQYEIDRHTATLRKYDSLIGFSTFTINMNEVVEIKEEPPVTVSFGTKLVNSLKAGFESFGRGLQDFAIWLARNLIGVVIFAAVVIAGILITRRQLRRRKAKKNTQ